ncbi:MAG: hypothetical protein R3195_19140 [Gemmatimonadota bacterium]|nr:hypothetical protein [Gemmatimonadota bacterium]
MPNVKMDTRDPGDRGFAAYAIWTLVLVAAATALLGGRLEPSVGLFAAWLVQLAAFKPLARAVSTRRDATRAWLGGLVLRGGGLLATGGLALGGVVGREVPIAYGVGMTALLLLEAGWLFRRLPRPGVAATDNGIERTTTG